MKSEEKRDIGPRRPDPRDDIHVIADLVLPVHRRQNPVGAGLNRQMQIGRQRGIVRDAR